MPFIPHYDSSQGLILLVQDAELAALNNESNALKLYDIAVL